uniref:Uncharacterized protein n=1 Tax=Acrobeloides nanus TaxID=290746 RepID=A0A914DJ31_9BILA
MGNCESAEVAEQTANSKKIDKELYTPPVRLVQKLLLLGGLYYDEGIEFIKKQFGKLYRNRQKLYMHETCATDTNQVRHILNSAIDTIIQENLKDTGML